MPNSRPMTVIGDGKTCLACITHKNSKKKIGKKQKNYSKNFLLKLKKNLIILMYKYQ